MQIRYLSAVSPVAASVMTHYFSITETIWCTNIICIDLLFIEELLTLCVFLRIRKRNFLELSDLCELESSVAIEK